MQFAAVLIHYSLEQGDAYVIAADSWSGDGAGDDRGSRVNSLAHRHAMLFLPTMMENFSND